jgi:hypothetical protein
MKQNSQYFKFLMRKIKNSECKDELSRAKSHCSQTLMKLKLNEP